MDAIQLPEISDDDLKAISKAQGVLARDGCRIQEDEGGKPITWGVHLSKSQAKALADILASVLEACDWEKRQNG